MDEPHQQGGTGTSTGTKVNGIKQIVKFKEILQKWQSVTLRSKKNRGLKGGIPQSPTDPMMLDSSRSPRSPSDRKLTRDSSNSHSGRSSQSHSGRRVPLASRNPSPLSENSSPISNRGNLSPAISRRLANVICDSDEESCASPEPPPDVPEGYLAVYVGPELRRFIIPTSYLSHNLFKVLLEKAEEEFGFDHNGGLTIPCETETFKYLLKCMENHQKAHPDDTPAGAWKLVE